MSDKLITIIDNFKERNIPEERKSILKELIDYIIEKRKSNDPIRLNFICTHNSRRSVLCQVWATTMAQYFKIKHIECYSGGTEATEVFPKIIETLSNQGFLIKTISGGKNPVYSLRSGFISQELLLFSKKIDDKFNPTSDFCAIMTCSTADKDCPFVSGSDKKIPIRYEDPKYFDNSPEMNQKYIEKSLEIGQEMWYIFSKIDI